MAIERLEISRLWIRGSSLRLAPPSLPCEARARNHMFEGFANVWTAVTLGSKLGTKAPLSVDVAGEKLVLFRDERGEAHALVDRCPHRGVALSLGKVKKGCIECPFHGWQFAGDGSVRHVPWNPDAKKASLAATALPTRERAGLLWLFTAPIAAAEAPTLVLPHALERADLVHSHLEVTWNTHWTRAMENMLDWPHLPFVHRATIGRGMAKRLHDATRMDVDIEETSTGLFSRDPHRRTSSTGRARIRASEHDGVAHR